MESIKKRGVWFWLVVVSAGIVGLSVAEAVALKQVRAEVLADEGIFAQYVDRLEAPIVIGFNKWGYYPDLHCKRYRVRGLWHYKVCLHVHTFEGERRSSMDGSLIFGKCKSPYFTVALYLPNSIFSTYESEHNNVLGRIEADKSSCEVI